MLFPIVTHGKPLPDDFPTPCKCLKYVREIVLHVVTFVNVNNVK